MFGVLDVLCHCHKLQRLVSATVFKICKPSRTCDADILLTVFNVHFRTDHGIAVRHHKSHVFTVDALVKSRACPYPVCLDERKHFFVRHTIDVTNYEESLFCINYPSQKLAEHRERRIRHDDIRLVAQPTYLLASEIAVAFEVFPFKILEVNPPVPVRVVVEDEYLAAFVLRRFTVLRCRILKERAVLRRLSFGCVARGDKLLQTQPLEVLREEEREVAPFGIVAR